MQTPTPHRPRQPSSWLDTRARFLTFAAVAMLALGATACDDEETAAGGDTLTDTAGGDATGTGDVTAGDGTSTGDATGDATPNPGPCTEPDPSDVTACTGDGDCGADEVCAPTTDCIPSVCQCDEALDTWTCTADCGMFDVCQPADPPPCAEPDPSDVQVCESDADCNGMRVCLPATECVPSSCTCDETSGGWICTDDCGMPDICQRPAGMCDTPNPAEVDTCESDADCTGEDVCTASSECVPSTCQCDETTGDWICTADCTQPSVCQAAGGCGPDPSAIPTCETDDQCPTGETCAPSTACVSSSCQCDEASGTWSCTDDCGMPNTCQESMPVACDTPNPAGCTDDAQCSGDMVCVVDENTCITTSCFCDETTASWTCTDDCGGGTCEMPTMGGTCTTDADCTAGSQWCESGTCTDCDNSGLACDIACAAGEELEERNGCFPCNCVPSNECSSDADCNGMRVCVAGGECLSWCPADDPSCCYGNTCQMP